MRVRIARTLIGYLAIGIAVTIFTAWLCAALRPTDGWPNVFGTLADGWVNTYRMPQLRIETEEGEAFLDVLGNSLSTRAGYAPVSRFRLKTEDEWLFTTYPKPADVHQSALALWPDRSKWRPPAWMVRCEAGSPERQIQTSAYGWPTHALKGTERTYMHYGADGEYTGNHKAHEGYITLSGAQFARLRRLPYLPIWSGLLIDAALYGAMCFMLVQSFTFTRRSLRRRRGLCPACAYDLRATPPGSPCPECGANSHLE